MERSTLLAAVAAIAVFSAPVEAQLTDRVSVDSSGAQGNDASEVSWPSFDGRFVVFQSLASNLVAGDTNGLTDIFVHDRRTGVTERVNVDSSGAQAADDQSFLQLARSISDDGRYVVFYSYASNLFPGDTDGVADVFVHDRATGATRVVSVSSSGALGDGESDDATISGDGSCVAFYSFAGNLVPGDANQNADVFVRVLATATTEIVSVDSTGRAGNGWSEGAALSRDGRFVTFNSVASNLVPGDTNVAGDYFIHDRATGVTEMIDVDATGAPGVDGAGGGSISDDGRFVAFVSDSSNLLGPGVVDYQILVRDRQSGTNSIVSVDSSGVPGNRGSALPSISADGRFVAFQSGATNLVAGDTNGKDDVFIHDRLTGATTRCDLGPGGDQSDGSGPWWAGTYPSISGDGRVVSFTGWGDDLVNGDSNGLRDVFVRSPWLTLEADPPQVAAGATLTFTTWTGDASNLALLALMDVDGVPMFLPAAIGTFDGSGVWSLLATVPPGLSGSVLTLETYGFVPTGKVQPSNEVAVTFQ